ncbi:hypothetical protein AMATHDRAFT_55691 [Amanita thiersii Skay4041]|uniref:Uncharacterized protein n=1 Tax=Amanita thiersii Skay4041 TaxID=703135 RepID=A0A2A9NYT5_9AGAR|nr:hypothetical protein AMATHDRAFT_55691 [Amanita thiersii Skay4041]
MKILLSFLFLSTSLCSLVVATGRGDHYRHHDVTKAYGRRNNNIMSQVRWRTPRSRSLSGSVMRLHKVRRENSLRALSANEDASNLEPRFVQLLAEIALQVVVEGIVKPIQAQIEQDKLVRSEFTQKLVEGLFANDTSVSYVVIATHVEHQALFDGKKPSDWDQTHAECPVKFGPAVKYDVYRAKSGQFIRKGDGGFLNWAWIGYNKSVSANGAEIVFETRDQHNKRGQARSSHVTSL